MEKEFGFAPRFIVEPEVCQSEWCVPGCTPRRTLGLGRAARWQPLLNKKSNKYTRCYSCRTAHLAPSESPADGDGRVLLAVATIPLSLSRPFPVSPPYSALVRRNFSEHPCFSALEKAVPFSPPIPGSLICPLRGKKCLLQEHIFLGKISKEKAILLID